MRLAAWLAGLILCAQPALASGIDETLVRAAQSSGVERLLQRAGFREIRKSYALVIGISTFDEFNDLPTEQDATAVARYLVEEAGFDHVHLLTGDKVTKARLNELMLDDFRTLVGSGDRFLFYWSGHGETLGVGSGARGFLPVKASRKGRFSTMVSMDDIADWDSYIEARQVLYLMDSCFSGLVGVAPQSDLGEITRAQLSGPSRHVITAGRADEQTIAVDQLGGSVFTHALLKGLRGAADAGNALGKDGLVTVGELKAYLGQEVSRLRLRYNWPKSITPQIRDLSASDGAFFFPIPAAFPEDAPPPDPPTPPDPVAEVQQALIDLGYDPGPVDGVLSFKTRAALITFQGAEGLLQTGKIDEATLERIPFALAALVQRQGGDTPDAPQPLPPALRDEFYSAGKRPPPFRPCDDCPVFVSAPGGTMALGAQPPKDAPVSQRRDVAPFWISRTEITRAQFRTYAEATGIAFVDAKTSDSASCFDWQPGDKLRKTATAFGQDLDLSDDHPVSCVSRMDAQGYIDWLNETLDGPAYRLPTEAEFEFLLERNLPFRIEAAGLSKDIHSDGDVACALGNFGDASSQFSWRNTACSDRSPGPAVVASFPADQNGIHDLAGNLWEWVSDCWSPVPGSLGPAPSCATGGTLKGGSFDDPVKNAAPETRQSAPETRRQTNIGFRVARDLE